MLTVGIIIIGDEILNGSVNDTLSYFLCKRFHANGIQTKRILSIPDDVEIIATSVKMFSDSFDFVVTTGGVGPTHDDVTYEAVAKAFSTTLRNDEEMEKFYDWYIVNQDASANKLISIPSVAKVLMVDLETPLENSNNKFPIVKTQNVFCFPGIPSYTQAIFLAMEKQYFNNSCSQFFSREIYLNVDEIDVLPMLNEVVAEFKNKVQFGSYPLSGNPHRKKTLTKIYIESLSLTDCLQAEISLLWKFPPQWNESIRPETPNFELIERLINGNFELTNICRLSHQIISKCFEEYNIFEMFLCFNGGKDCTVLLTLILHYCQTKSIKHPLKLLYFHDSDSFVEVDSFIEEIKNNYRVDLITLPVPMKTSLSEFLQTESQRKMCFLGQRKSDPRSKNLEPMQETDSDWPKLMRVFPLLHWSYKNIWDFIRCVNVPYCSLYDRGFTSLGSKKNTGPNPALKVVGDANNEYYGPAFLLNDPEYERTGRLNQSSDGNQTHL